jgi:polyisoprenoid-binding protein YceI
VTTRRSPLFIGLIGLVVLAALAGAAGLAYLFLRGAPPPAVGLGTASPGGSPGASQAATTAAPLPTGAAGTIGADGLDGTWTIDTTVGSFSDFSSSFVGYRVNETFADNSANTAVGRTPALTGSLVLDGTSITAVDVTADMTRLQSDDDRRDGRLGEQAIETNEFPEATFHLTAPIDLGAGPVEGATITATATGELTLHGVTRGVTVPIEARLSGDVVTVTGSVDILFADYEIERPSSFLVLSIEDHGIMEFQLHFRHG